MTDQHPEADPFADASPMSRRNAELVQRVYEEEGRRGFYRTAARQFPATLDRLLDAARKEGAARAGVDREAVARIIAEAYPDNEPCNAYAPADAILALGEPVSSLGSASALGEPAKAPTTSGEGSYGGVPVDGVTFAGTLIEYDGEFDTGYRFLRAGDTPRLSWLQGASETPLYRLATSPTPPAGTVETGEGA